MGKFQDLTGQRFGRLTIIKRSETNKYNKPAWICKCDCGNKVVVGSNLLKMNQTMSCGCLNYDNHKKYNDYCIYNNIVFVKFGNCDEYFICDLEDWNNLKQYYWRKNTDGYAICNINNKQQGKECLFFHRVVMDCPNDMQVDHIYQVSRGVCDNRKSNLRIVTSWQNNVNKSTSKRNTSGYVGVNWDKQNNKWFAQIMVNNKTKNLGRFDNIEDAIKARKEAELKYFGEYRCLYND